MPSRGEMAGQDFNTVTFGSRPGGGGTNAASVKQAQRSGVAVDTSRRTGVGNSNIASTGLSAAKLDNETEELKHQTVDKELRLAMMKARTAKGLTQKQLAQQLNMQPQVINEYEAGKAIPNNAVIAKIERALGCKLPRAPKK